MRKLIILIFICTFGGTFMKAQTGPPACNDFVSLNGRYFQCGGELFYPLAVSYSFNAVYAGTTVDSTYSNVFLSRQSGYGPCEGCFTHCDFENCDSDSASEDILNDLSVVHDMGFNAIRTTFGFESTIKNGTDTLSQILFRCDGWANPLKMYITTAPNDPGRAKIFEFIDQILETAHEDSIKVLLDIGYDSLTYGNYFFTYLDYLKLLAQHISQLDTSLQQTLIAYVILEESEYTQPDFPKSKICSMVSQMYDTLKTYDPVHLVAIGGLDIGDVMQWDPGVMKLDFWCPHLYPLPTEYEENADAAVERVHGNIYWLKNNCPMPWMIGETGFGATDDEIGWLDTINHGWPHEWDCGYLGFPYVNGELENAINGETYTQTTYADSLLKWVRDCGGSGFTMWDFQEIWGTNPYGWIPPDVNGNCHGILRHGEAITGTADIGGTIFKPVVDVFRDYLDSNGKPPAVDNAGGQMPGNYYNPFNHPTISNTGCSPHKYHQVTGTITDQNSDDFEDAFIYGWVDLGYVSNPTERSCGLLYTFTNSDGEYILYAYNYLIDNYNNDYYLANIHISAPGSEIDTTVWGTVDAVFDANLTKANLSFNGAISDYTVISGNSENFTGWNTLTTSDLVIENGATSDMYARTEVNIQTEFHAEYGSEVHIFLAESFPDCGNFSAYKMPVNNSGNYTVNESEKGEIELQFKKPVSSFLLVSPNPGNGKYQIELNLSESDVVMKRITVFDMTGRLVYSVLLNQKSFIIDLSSHPNGMYFLHVSDNFEDQYQEKLIIQ